MAFAHLHTRTRTPERISQQNAHGTSATGGPRNETFCRIYLANRAGRTDSYLITFRTARRLPTTESGGTYRYTQLTIALRHKLTHPHKHTQTHTTTTLGAPTKTDKNHNRIGEQQPHATVRL